MAKEATRKFRTLFLSDIHLGSKVAKADFLLDFLKHHDAETIYLAAYHHGVQTFDGDGESIGAYVEEGTVSRVSTSWPSVCSKMRISFSPRRRTVASKRAASGRVW